MDSTEFDTSVAPKLTEARALLGTLSAELNNANVVVLAESQGLFESAVYGVHKVIRKLEHGRGLVLVVESMGGSIDDAYSIASICREKFGSFKVIAPLFAKSAATLLVLAADERLLGCATLLGPVDPQVRHPEKGLWFPAHSIREALEQAESTKDPFVKMAMADKLDPFLIGAYKAASAVSSQYITEVAESWGLPNTSEIVATFTEKYRSHGYPISRSVLTKLGIPYTALSDQLDSTVCDLHDVCTDVIVKNESMIIMSEDGFVFEQDDFKRTETFPPKMPGRKPKSPSSVST